jgi:hypothetical protein
MHQWDTCFYLISEKRSNNWISNLTIQVKVDDALIKNKNLKARIEKVPKSYREKTVNKKSNQENVSLYNQLNDDIETFVAKTIIILSDTVSNTVLFACHKRNIAIKFSWILNDEINHHICNDIMRTRFIKKRDALFDEYIISRAQFLIIETYESIKIIVNTSTKSKWMMFLNVTLESTFMINAVTQDLLYVKELYFDTSKLYLHYNHVLITFVKRYNEHYLLKDNRISQIKQVFSIVKSTKMIKTAIAYQWHQTMTHAFEKIIQYLK